MSSSMEDAMVADTMVKTLNEHGIEVCLYLVVEWYIFMTPSIAG